MFGEPVVHVLTNDATLRRALVAQLQGRESLPVSTNTDPAMAAPGDVVVAPSSDCLPGQCAEFVARGVRVIVLAAIPAPAEKARYLAAGVFAYLPMVIDQRPLPAQVRSAFAAPRDGAAAEHDWLLLTNHGLVLIYLGSHPGAATATIAAAIGISEGRTRRVLRDLQAKGFVSVEKTGRANSYSVNAEARLLHPAMAHVRVGDFVGAAAPPPPRRE